jgi:hypothetical protein
MHPLTVTWAPHAYTEIGRTNLESFVHSGFDNLSATPNGLLHRKLSLLSAVCVGDNFLPFIWGQVSFAFHIAVSLNIPLIFFGENGEAEYGGSSEVEQLPGMPLERWSENYWKGVTAKDLVSFGEEIGFIDPDEARTMSRFYVPPDLHNTKSVPEHYWYGFFTNWRPQDNYYYASRATGFIANPQGRSEGTYSKYASLDDRLDGIHYLFGLLKFGLGRASSDAAHEIREGLITRAEGVSLVQRYDLEFPTRNYEFALRYLNLSPEQFTLVCDKFRTKHLWEKSQSGWGLRHPIWAEAQSV